MHGLPRHFFVIVASQVFQPSCCVSSLNCLRWATRKKQLTTIVKCVLTFLLTKRESETLWWIFANIWRSFRSKLKVQAHDRWSSLCIVRHLSQKGGMNLEKKVVICHFSKPLVKKETSPFTFDIEPWGCTTACHFDKKKCYRIPFENVPIKQIPPSSVVSCPGEEST